MIEGMTAISMSGLLFSQLMNFCAPATPSFAATSPEKTQRSPGRKETNKGSSSPNLKAKCVTRMQSRTSRALGCKPENQTFTSCLPQKGPGVGDEAVGPVAAGAAICCHAWKSTCGCQSREGSLRPAAGFGQTDFGNADATCQLRASVGTSPKAVLSQSEACSSVSSWIRIRIRRNGKPKPRPGPDQE